MFFWRRVLVEAFGAPLPHPLLGFPWKSCKLPPWCWQEKGEGKDLSSAWCHCSPSRSFIIVSTTLSLHLCPWHTQVDIILGLPVLVHGSERCPLSSVWVPSCVMADTHWHSHAEGQPPCIPCSVGWAASQVATCRLPELLWQPVLINIYFAQSSEFTCELKCD